MRSAGWLFSSFVLCAAIVVAVAASQRDWDDCSQSNDHDRRIAGCTRLLDDRDESTENRAIAHNNRGLAHQAKGNLDHALSDYNEAIRLDPKNPAVYSHRAAVYQAKGNDDFASRDYSEANRLEPK